MSAANLSTTLFLDFFRLPGAAGLASPKARLAFAKQRLATEGDWSLKIRCTLKNMNPLIVDEDYVEPNKSFPDEVGIASLNNLRQHFRFGGRWTVDG